MISNKIVTVINRTDRTLTVVKDGQEYDVPPGESPMRADVIPYAKNQNPVPGSDDGTFFESLIAVKGSKDPVDPLSSELLSVFVERLDRSSLAPDRQDGHKIDFARLRRAQISLQNPTEGFSDPSAALGGPA
jgi:hypothetical protein